ncbi:hypothetical protein RFI_20680, partial [Reticulomyxa filosa]
MDTFVDSENLYHKLQIEEYLKPYYHKRRCKRTNEQKGCVNRLDWNAEGTLLASCSDDTSIQVWNPFDSNEDEASKRRITQESVQRRWRRYGLKENETDGDSDNDNDDDDDDDNETRTNKEQNEGIYEYYMSERGKERAKKKTKGWMELNTCGNVLISTLHSENILGVRFIPGTNDRLLCSGGMDGLCCVHSLDHKTTINSYFCHFNCVKDVQVSPLLPMLFFSVCEDGTVRRFDLRMKYKCRWFCFFFFFFFVCSF